MIHEPPTPVLTKSGKPRKGKTTITESRFALRECAWIPVRNLLRRHLLASPSGEQRRMAEALGLADSQIHRYACEVCEHDQEPTFTIGMSILAYIAAKRRVIPFQNCTVAN